MSRHHFDKLTKIDKYIFLFCFVFIISGCNERAKSESVIISEDKHTNLKIEVPENWSVIPPSERNFTYSIRSNSTTFGGQAFIHVLPMIGGQASEPSLNQIYESEQTRLDIWYDNVSFSIPDIYQSCGLYILETNYQIPMDQVDELHNQFNRFSKATAQPVEVMIYQLADGRNLTLHAYKGADEALNAQAVEILRSIEDLRCGE